ncbi:hypothetical protein [uncultured Rhodoblastus sp.]|uniref:hypothetical protein n=1 Tax=uncultured Rhodoblastus sp. TaxID=543037 RepID=UPI0025FE56B6|nr:hypothetical protein [uncultured Rhodoblastus sp.]
MKILVGISALAAALVFLGAACVVQPATASNLSCKLAIKSACGGARPDGASVRACFDNHSGRLSRSCGQRLPRFVAVTHRCEADAHRLCSQAARASAVATCMHRRLADVGASCRSALAEVGVRRAAR